MPKHLRHILFLLFAFGFQLLAFSLKAQQLKLGNNPTQIEKSAVLELQSKNQGLLLTRVADTSTSSVIFNLHPPDGMIIYFTDGATSEPYGPNAGVYQRKDGAWQRIAQFFTDDTNASGPDDIEFTRSHDTITLHLPDASPIVRGVVNGIGQTFGGDKKFKDSLIAEGGFRANNAQIDDSLVLSNIKNANIPVTDWFLSTDANGNVILQHIDDVFWKLGGNTISTDKSDSIGTLSNTDLPIVTNGMERMRITKDGKIGIGTPTPSDTLTVNGSFKLGNGGNSFSAMAKGTFNYSITQDNGYVVPPHFSIPGIKKNAHVIVNPRNTLQNGNTIAIISWVRADQDGYISVCFFTTGSDNIPSTTFDVYYINP